MAATGVGLSVLDAPGVEEPVVFPEPEELVPVGDVIEKDIIVDKLASWKPPVGANLVAPPSLLYASQKLRGNRGGKVGGIGVLLTSHQ